MGHGSNLLIGQFLGTNSFRRSAAWPFPSAAIDSLAEARPARSAATACSSVAAPPVDIPPEGRHLRLRCRQPVVSHCQERKWVWPLCSSVPEKEIIILSASVYPIIFCLIDLKQKFLGLLSTPGHGLNEAATSEHGHLVMEPVFGASLLRVRGCLVRFGVHKQLSTSGNGKIFKKLANTFFNTNPMRGVELTDRQLRALYSSATADDGML
jgi:hypothetical protein